MLKFKGLVENKNILHQLMRERKVNSLTKSKFYNNS